MAAINALIVNQVNAYCGNAAAQSRAVGKKPETEACEFWVRMTEAWRKRGLPVTQNGVATKLDMSQGSTRRWYTGEGLPDIKVLMDIAERGRVTIDYLLNGTLPKSPTPKGSKLERLLAIYEVLDDAGRTHLVEAAEGRLARSGKKLNAPDDTKRDTFRATG
ncbi:MAG: helix-turn-helix domain-containing protein [Terriglobales bacterium]